MLTPFDRARAYVAKVPGAISGQSGHSATYDLARVLVHDFALPRDEAMRLLQDWNLTCSPPWSQRELEHKINQAESRPHSTPRGSKLSSVGSAPTVSATGRFIVNRGMGAQLVEHHGGADATEAIALLRTAFDPEDLVCICAQSIQSDDGKFRPGSHGVFKTAAQFVAEIEGGANPWTSPSESGRWIRINPYKIGSQNGADSNVSVYRHVLIEFDDLPEPEQLAVLRESNLPLTCIISSGGRSYHGWVRVDAVDRHQWEERRDQIYTYLEDARPCPANKNPGRFSRLPGCERGASVQRLIAGRTGPETWDEFEAWLRRKDLPQAMTYQQVKAVEIEPDPTCILGERWLCRGGSLTIVSTSGIGKSSFVLQFGVALATGTPFFGIANPKGECLRVGLIQAENDWGDLREALDGAGLWLSHIGRGGDGATQKLQQNMLFFRENVKTGAPFLAVLRQIIKEHQLQVVILDPLMAFFGDDVSDQKAMSCFLRNTLQPILEESGCVAILVHHTAKPKSEQSKNPNDIAYLGAGSSELTNWTREIAVLQREPGTDDVPGAFKLTLCKRGKRAGLRTKEGAQTHQIRIDHAKEGIFWRYADPLPIAPADDSPEYVPSRKYTSRPPKSKRGFED